MPSQSFTMDEWQRWISRQAKVMGQAGVEALRATAQQAKALAVKNIANAEPRPAVDTGELGRSYRVQMRPDGATLENTAPHAAIMEHGAWPFTPPMEPLIAWASRKSRGKTRAGAKRAAAAAVLARRAWVAIRRRGIEGRHFHEKALAEVPKILESEVRKAIRKFFTGGGK